MSKEYRENYVENAVAEEEPSENEARVKGVDRNRNRNDSVDVCCGNPVLENLFSRKSVRVYEKREIEPEKRQIILQAALQAPSPANMSLYTIIEVTDAHLREQLVQNCDGQTFIKDAPMVLMFTADFKKWHDLFENKVPGSRRPGAGDLMLAWEDTYIAAQNAVTAAWSLGIGSCYIGHITQHYEANRELFCLPDYVLPVCMVVFGYPTEQQIERSKPERFEAEDMICRNYYQEKTAEEFSDMLKRRQGRDDESYERWIRRFCQVKWNAPFREEMDRSVGKMLESWIKDGGTEGSRQ